MASTLIRTHMRWFIRRDMPEVLAIEAASFLTEPWTEDDFLTLLRNRNTIGLVAEHQDHVLAYAVYTLHKTCFHLHNLAVHPDHRRQGVGSQVVGKLINKLSTLYRRYLILEVDETNLPAQLFFHSLGFRARRVLRGWYGGDRDAYRMAYRVVKE